MISLGFLSLAFTRHRTWNQFGLRGALLPATNEVQLPRQTASAKQNIYTPLQWSFQSRRIVHRAQTVPPYIDIFAKEQCRRKKALIGSFLSCANLSTWLGGRGGSESQNQGISLSDHTAAGPADLEESPTGPGSPRTRRKFTHHSGPPTPRSTLP